MTTPLLQEIGRDELTRRLAPGSTWRQRNIFDGQIDPRSSVEHDFVTIRGVYPENRVHVNYSGGTNGGPMLRPDDRFGIDNRGQVFLCRADGTAYLAYTPVEHFRVTVLGGAA